MKILCDSAPWDHSGLRVNAFIFRHSPRCAPAQYAQFFSPGNPFFNYSLKTVNAAFVETIDNIDPLYIYYLFHR